jgi:hypothetical protein
MSSTLQGANALTASFTSGLMVVGTTTSGINTTVAIQYAINGRFAVAKTAMTSQAYACEPGTGLLATAPNAFVNIPVGKACAFAWLLDSAGSVTCAQGDIVDEIGSGTSAQCQPSRLTVRCSVQARCATPLPLPVCSFRRQPCTVPLALLRPS